MDAPTKRINAPLLQANQNKLVRIIGKCEEYNPASQEATLISNGSITLDLSAVSSDHQDLLEVNKIYEVLGKVANDTLKINVYSIIKFTDNTNLKAAEKLVELSARAPELFS
ncbi:uncharacterized protein KGF55_002407 [Candida pseudojiufengensis]|uniref:uncharacterized protein n=1 Tax=Candida pseudojiufengensis TaxID=497109 RepID=UPI002224E2F7|nr:uncharacterized protein KGF55_002407 [Candida pseudojiufengensis]KAI5963527.1 hypothetical protein KGF55_002407 [Candida pseudojiufengensis]